MKIILNATRDNEVGLQQCSGVMIPHLIIAVLYYTRTIKVKRSVLQMQWGILVDNYQKGYFQFRQNVSVQLTPEPSC